VEFTEERWVQETNCSHRIFHTAARIKKSEDQSERTRDLRTRVAKCVVVDGGIFEHLL